MKISNSKQIPIEKVIVKRAERQRTLIEVESDGLLDSIKARGILNPIILDKDFNLIAGERRFTAAKEAKFETVPVRFIEELSHIEAQIIELEENIKRSDLTWQDHTRAIANLHSLYLQLDPEWTQIRTGRAVGLKEGSISMFLRVNKELSSERIAKAAGIAAAYNILSRVDERKIGDALSDIADAGNIIFSRSKEKTNDSDNNQERKPSPPPPPPDSILNTDFNEWAKSYSGPRFNFIHCDFPYGISAFGGPQSGRDKWNTYNDSPDVYWQLIKTFCTHIDKFMAPSSQLMFWFSFENYVQTLEMFRDLAPDLNFSRFPLVWVKSDNVGVLPDPKRGPRRIYETCFIALREDRFILRAVSNAYAAPTDKAHHASTKPEPVLRHFMQMFVDESTTMFDPTCGSGSSLRAAESLGAKTVLGLEIDKEHCDNAKSALRQFRSLRKAGKSV